MRKERISRSDFYLIPNLVTLSRTLAIPLIVILTYWQWDILAALVFGLAGLSDYFDGYLARRYQKESKLGVLLDPLADKLIIIAVMVMLLWLQRLHIPFDLPQERSSWDWVAPLLVIVTVSRELAITGLRSMASGEGVTMAADRGGKLKTWIQFIAILCLLVHREPITQIGYILLVISVIAALVSGVSYTLRFLKGLPS